MLAAAWRRRFLAPAVSFPSWARDAPERLVYSSNEPGKWEIYGWDRATDDKRRLTDRPEGTRGARIDPRGEQVWWFDDRLGNERGRWLAQRFDGGDAVSPAQGLPEGYPGGLLLGNRHTVIGITDEAGSTIFVADAGGSTRELYHHRESAHAAALSEDETLVAIEHSERGDARHPAVRVLDLTGAVLGEIDDGPNLAVEALAWAPVAGDQRLLISHQRIGTERPAIWSLDTRQVQQLPLDLPGEVFASWYQDASALLIEHSHRGRDELFRLDLGAGDLTALEVPPGTIAAARIRPDGELWLQWSDAAQPWEVRSGAATVLRPEGEPAPAGVPFRDLFAGEVHSFLAEPPGPAHTRLCSTSTAGRSPSSLTLSPPRFRPGSTTGSPWWR